MRKRHYTVNDVVKITGITRRTLYYYDEIGLLKATDLSSHGYRLYDTDDFERLQVILFLKEMDLSLKDISHILQLSRQEQNNVLRDQYEILLRKRQKLDTMMSNLERFVSGEAIFDLEIPEDKSVLPLKEQYKREAKVTYGETKKYKEYEQNMSRLTGEEKDILFATFEEGMKKTFILLDRHIKESPDSDKVQSIIKRWVEHFHEFFVCDNEILKCIANTYRFDSRFKKYINQFSSEDLSDFVYRAVMFYCGVCPPPSDS